MRNRLSITTQPSATRTWRSARSHQRIPTQCHESTAGQFWSLDNARATSFLLFATTLLSGVAVPVQRATAIDRFG
ncbi:MAG: hypothetical protein DCC58_13640 [Chloroflexi bacterium]|nr:MAG: hypothetical protein DCC58_13640 [Chloroflexota bacterium]